MGHIKKIVALMALASAATPVAADRLITVSAGVNRATVDVPQVPVLPIYVDSSSTLGSEYSDTGARIAVHVDVLPFVSFETGWADLGSARGTASLTRAVDGHVDTFDISQSGEAYWVAYTPGIRFDNIELHGKLGAVRSAMTFSGVDVDSTDALVGAGVALHFDSGFGLRLDAERLGDDATQFGLSVTYGF